LGKTSRDMLSQGLCQGEEAFIMETGLQFAKERVGIMNKSAGVEYRSKMYGIVAIIIYFVSGLLLLLFPDLMTDIAAYTISIGLCVAGLIAIIGYIRADVMAGVHGFGLASGLIGLFLGIALLSNPDFIKGALPFLWGIFLLIGGFGKVQFAVDCLRMRDRQWWALLIGAAISFLLGIFAITKPTFVAKIVAQFIGISMLVEAVLDFAALMLMRRRFRAFEDMMFKNKG